MSDQQMECPFGIEHRVQLQDHEKQLDELRPKVDDAQMKLNNGLSDLPGEMKSLRKEVGGVRGSIWILVATVVVAFLAGGFWLGHKLGVLETTMEAHIEWTDHGGAGE